MWRSFTRLLALLLFAVVILSAWTAWGAFSPTPMAASPQAFSIAPGSSLRSATRQMIQAGVHLSAWQFNLLARVTAHVTDIKAGSYEVSEGATPWDILGKITRGDFSQSEIVLIEGWNFRQIRSALHEHPDLRHESDALGDEEIMSRLGSPGVRPEGWFFPDTYLFAKGESDMSVLARAHQAMQRQLQTAWAQRSPGLPLRSPFEALILASIVEKETGRSEDRSMIAGVFVNRLRAGMRLQTDPTVIYGLGSKFDGNLRKRDLLADHPFNTYMRDGLPPWPIAMPGQAALKAALVPANTDAFYFVARGDGSSAFSRTLQEHNRAVAKFQLKHQ